MMAIQFYCQCGREIVVANEAAGRSGKCPTCREIILVPPRTTLKPPPVSLAYDESATDAFPANGSNRMKIVGELPREPRIYWLAKVTAITLTTLAGLQFFLVAAFTLVAFFATEDERVTRTQVLMQLYVVMVSLCVATLMVTAALGLVLAAHTSRDMRAVRMTASSEE